MKKEIEERIASFIKKMPGCNFSELLIIAARLNDKEVVDRMLELGVDINFRGEYKNTALTSAIRYSNLELADHLIDLGADVNLRNAAGATPIICAAYHKHSWTGGTGLISKLIEAGADIHVRGHSGKTALIVASQEGNSFVMYELLKAGADIYARDFELRNSFDHAKNPEVLGLLKEAERRIGRV